MNTNKFLDISKVAVGALMIAVVLGGYLANVWKLYTGDVFAEQAVRAVGALVPPFGVLLGYT